MARRKKKKTSLKKRRRRQIFALKLTLALMALLLPCLWFVRQETVRNEPLQVAKTFAEHLVHARFDEAASLATPAAVSHIDMIVTLMGSQSDQLRTGDARFRVTKAQVYMPGDTANVVQGIVIAADATGNEMQRARLVLPVVKVGDEWLVDFRSDLFQPGR